MTQVTRHTQQHPLHMRSFHQPHYVCCPSVRPSVHLSVRLLHVSVWMALNLERTRNLS